MKKIIMAFAIAGFATSAFAADSEIMYMTKAGTSDVEVDFNYSSSSVDSLAVDTTTPTTTEDTTLMSLGVEYSMGINEMLDWYAGLGFVLSGEAETSTSGVTPSPSNTDSISGMQDLNLGLTGHHDLGASMLHWTANLAYSMGDLTREVTKDATADAGSDTDASANSGQMVISVNGVWGYKLSEGNMLGAILEFPLMTGDQNIESTGSVGGTATEVTGSGGGTTTFGAFYENTKSETCVWGAKLEMATTAGYEYELADGTAAGGSNDDKSMDITVFSRSAMGNGHLLADFTYGMVQAVDGGSGAKDSGTDTDGGSGMALRVGYRMGF